MPSSKPVSTQPALRFKPLLTAQERLAGSLQPVHVASHGRYFVTAHGLPFLLIAQNEAVSWPGLRGLYRRRDIPAVESYLAELHTQGVNVLRLMLEYCQPPHPRYFEQPVGHPVRETIRFWDDLFALCEKHGIHILLTLWETFFMSRNWRQHPYNRRNGGPCSEPGDFMIAPAALAAERDRFRFVIERWGSSPALFGFDLFNEIHPFWGGTPQEQAGWVTAMASFVRAEEQQRYGRTHPLTVSIFGAMPSNEEADLIYRNPALDFATTHVYGESVVDTPRNTIDAALYMNESVRYALSQISDGRPYTDSESGPIHLFGNLHRTLPEDFDREYFHNMSWAHLASGGAGGGMRWPCRSPHRLPPAMLGVQQALARFVSACGIPWHDFRSQNIDHTLHVSIPSAGRTPPPGIIAMGCGDHSHTLVWLLQDRRARNGRNKQLRPIAGATLRIRNLPSPWQSITCWDTSTGRLLGETSATWDGDSLAIPLPRFDQDIALVIQT